MKYIFSALILLLITSFTNAQTYKAIYRLTHKVDTVSQLVRTDDMFLVFDNEKSVYISTKRFVFDSTDLAMGGPNQRLNPMPLATPDRIYYNRTDQMAGTIKPWVGDTLFIIDKMSNIAWTLLDSTKMLADYKLKLAKGSFRGRQYTVWYCPEIPVSAGPWKLNGLPGLIIEAADATQTVKFEFLGLSLYHAGQAMLRVPEKAQFISPKDWANISAAANSSVTNVPVPPSTQSSLPTGTNMTITRTITTPAQGSAVGTSGKQARLLNNPLELTGY